MGAAKTMSPARQVRTALTAFCTMTIPATMSGIVVGRMQKEEILPWTHLNGLKIRYKWTHEG